MTFETFIDPDTFGLAFYWNGPLEGVHLLDTHRITIIILNLVIGIEWSK